jgi:hypothetical protein
MSLDFNHAKTPYKALWRKLSEERIIWFGKKWFF